MSILRATYTMNMTSGLAEDAAINVWHFRHDTEIQNDFTASVEVAAALHNFYRSAAGYWSGMVSRANNAHSCSVARLAPGNQGADDDVASKALSTTLSGTTAWAAAASAVNLPPEVAITMSFRGDVNGLNEVSGDTRPIARRRGRVYLGPFNASVMNTTGPPLILAAVPSNLGGWYQTLVDDVNTSIGATKIYHVVYSPTTAQDWPVADMWIDNAPDTVRSRGTAATLRNNLTINQLD